MLPDFPLLKRELHRLLVLGVQVEQPGASLLLRKSPRRPMREGAHTVLVRETGEEEEVPLNKYAAEQMIDLTEAGLPTLSEAYRRYRALISQMDEEVAADFEELVDRTAESLGNVVDKSSRGEKIRVLRPPPIHVGDSDSFAG